MAGPAADVVILDDEDQEMQAEAMLRGEYCHQPDFQSARDMADDLQEKWAAAKSFVEEHEEIIDHLAYNLTSAWSRGEALEGWEVREYVSELS